MKCKWSMKCLSWWSTFFRRITLHQMHLRAKWQHCRTYIIWKTNIFDLNFKEVKTKHYIPFLVIYFSSKKHVLSFNEMSMKHEMSVVVTYFLLDVNSPSDASPCQVTTLWHIVLLRYFTNSDYTFDIFKLFLSMWSFAEK
jgi:hypothetical protein